jgi:hypothetical protein
MNQIIYLFFEKINQNDIDTMIVLVLYNDSRIHTRHHVVDEKSKNRFLLSNFGGKTKKQN